ncbi:MAG: hypothetical protein ABI597_05770 [Gammaproteobacteria bacterium]
MRHPQRPIFKSNRPFEVNRNWFAILSILPQIIIAGLFFGIFYYINNHGLFTQWIDYINWTIKIIIAFQLLIASARSLIAPLLALALAGIDLYFIQSTGDAWLSSSDAWELIIAGVIGLMITIIVKLLKR